MESEIKKYGCFVKGVEQKYPNVAPGTPIYANAVVVDNIVYVSGMTAQKFEDGSCTTNTMQDQMWVALSKMKQVLGRRAAAWRTCSKRLSCSRTSRITRSCAPRS